MIGQTPFEAILVIIFFISTVLFYMEVKEYYFGEAAAKKVNIMYIYRITTLSIRGKVYGIMSVISLIISLIIIYIKH